MGKGTIISHIADGQYNVEVNYDTTDIDARILILTDRETLLETAIASETDALKIRLLKLQILSVQKQIEFLQDTTKVPADFTATAWCADLTTDLTGEVGTIEIARERENGLQIQPGYDSNATYSITRDGQLTPTYGESAAGAMYNYILLPGAQKWKPMFRYGTITSIDSGLDTCDVTLDAITSSQQGLNINQADTLTDVPIDYMNCNSAAFAVGDEVLIKFTNYDFTTPVVIGFKEEPKPCECWNEFFDTTSGGVVSQYTAIDDTYPWLSLYRVYTQTGFDSPVNVTGSHPEAEPAATPGIADDDGYMDFELPSITVSDLYEYQNQWTYDPSPNFLHESASKIIVDAEALVACYMDSEDFPDFIHQYIVYFEGEDESGNPVEFDFIVVYNSPQSQPGSGLGRIGCSDGSNSESAWVSYTSGSTTVYCKNILNNEVNLITLPISNVKIYSANIYMLIFRNPLVSSSTTIETSMKINRISIC